MLTARTLSSSHQEYVFELGAGLDVPIRAVRVHLLWKISSLRLIVLRRSNCWITLYHEPVMHSSR